MNNLFAAISILIGGLGTFLTLLVAFGVHITPDQHTAIIGVASLALLIVGVWFHPAIPVGNPVNPKPPPAP